MRHISFLLNGFFDMILYPFGWLPPIWGLLFISVASGLGMIFVFRAVSDQEGIARLRRRMGGEILGILLHVSSPITVLRFAGRLIRSNTSYLVLLLKPLLVMAVPFMILWGQLDARFSSSGAQEGFQVTVTVQYAEEVPPADSIEITAEGVLVVPPLMVVDTLEQASFRLEERNGPPACITVDGVRAGFAGTDTRSGSIVLRGFDADPSPLVLLTPMVHVVEGSGEGPVSGWYSLPGKDFGIFGMHWSWEAVFLVFSMVAALAGARIMKIRV
ncbi:MAG: hypothetical protein AVO35_04170 [Candidatus Aegiribacteria sp. MLS_C]|nr:MAG: hypothetical protein AVO35_04170 [Candidatus Aegiribacteria sp. MLS_C]